MASRQGMLIGLCVLAAGCGDSSSASDGGSGGRDAAFDASVDTQSGGSGGAMSTPIGGMTGGTGLSSSLDNPIPPDVVLTCENAPRYNLAVPDAGDDACLGCIVEHCCVAPYVFCFLTGTGPNQLPPPSYCYTETFKAVRDCFAREIEAGSTEESWYIVANCVIELDPIQELDPSPLDPENPMFNSRWGMVSYLAECVVGPRPASWSPDAGVLDSGLGADDDGGSRERRRRGLPYSPPQCAQECFEGWR